MVALAERFTREANSSKTRTSQNRHRGNSSPRSVFLQRKNRGPALNNRILSQKYLDDTINWYYYGYRYYDPELGRWPSRDPIGEEGFRIVFSYSRELSSDLNPYGFVQNEPVAGCDVSGLGWFCDGYCNTPWSNPFLCFLVCAGDAGGGMSEGRLCRRQEEELDCGKKMCGYVYEQPEWNDQLPCITLVVYLVASGEECALDASDYADEGIDPDSLVDFCPGDAGYDQAVISCNDDE